MIFRSHLVSIICLVALTSTCIGQPISSTPSVGNITDDAEARQLRIYREALLQGSTEEVRVDAAIGLLLRKDPQSRQVLVSALKSSDNLPAQQAVSKALIRSRGISQSIGAVDVFLEPLLNVLQSNSSEQAELAAEAMLAFDYEVIENSLIDIIQNTSADKQKRIHAVYAIQLRPEPSALKTLIGLLDDPDTEVAQAAENALQESFGIPVGTSRSEWAAILSDLQQKAPGEIRRERLLRQEIKLRQVQAESTRWQKLYLASLDKQYELLDDAAKAKMILEMMGSDLAPLRLWTLDKIVLSPTTVNDKVKEKLFAFLLDNSREVRLQTAKTLKTLIAINPGPTLLERFAAEKEPEVALAIFEALGEAVFFAFSPGSPIELPLDIKDQTLQIASEYLSSDDSRAVLISAEVFRKLLELNDIESSLSQLYLQQLQKRYQISIERQNPELRGNLLSILAHLCGQGGAKAAACELYEPLFTEALSVENNPPLRLAAATGMAYIDKTKALGLFKRYGLQESQSPALRHVVIDVAGQAGDAPDLNWLLKILTENGQGDVAWEAIKSICRRQTASYLVEFAATLQSANGVKTDQIREILTIAEQKAAGEQNLPLLNQIRQTTLTWMAGNRLWEPAVAYLQNLSESGQIDNFPETIQVDILKIFLYSNQSDKFIPRLRAALTATDIRPEGSPLAMLREYFTAADIAKEIKTATLKAIESISIENRPAWTSFIKEMNLLVNPPVPTAASQTPGLIPGPASLIAVIMDPNESISR